MALTTFVAGQVLQAQQLNDSYAAVDWNENVIINGAMTVAQRGTSTASITTAGYYTIDRWSTFINTLGTWTQTQETDAPTGSGLRNSLKMLCTTAAAAPSASNYFIMRQILEGQNVQIFKKGTASATTFVLSFWVKSNATGTYIAELEDADNNRSVSATYTVSASGVWEKKSITFPADTTGVFDNDNAGSLRVNWWLAAGTTYTSGTLATTWTSTTSANRAPGLTNLAAATNNYWQITGVQLQPSRESQFLFQDYGTVLAQCQRYFYAFTIGINGLSGFCDSTTVALGYMTFPVTMRATPTFTATATDFEVRRTGTSSSAGTAITSGNSESGSRVDLTVASGLTGGQGIGIAAVSGTKTMKFSAEL